MNDESKLNEFRAGMTGFRNLLMIGELHAGRAYDKTLEYFRTPIDDERLKHLGDAVADALIATTSAHTVIGALIAYCEIKEIPEDIMTDLGFTVCGLGELNEVLVAEAQQIDYEILLRKTIEGKGLEKT